MFRRTLEFTIQPGMLIGQAEQARLLVGYTGPRALGKVTPEALTRLKMAMGETALRLAAAV